MPIQVCRIGKVLIVIKVPFLKYAGDGKEHSKRETTERLANTFHLSDAERRVLLSSGKQELFDNRVGWARTYLKNAGLINSYSMGLLCDHGKWFSIIKTKSKIY